MIAQDLLNSFLRSPAPSALQPDVDRNLTGADLFHESRHGLTQTPGLPGDSRTNEEYKKGKSSNQQEIDDTDRSTAAMHHFFETEYRWINEVGKEYGKQKQDQGLTRNVEKTQSEGKQQECKENSRRP